MQTRLLLLVPVLVLTAGCSEKIEAQESGANAGAPVASEAMAKPDHPPEAAEEPAGEEIDLKFQSPVGLD
jgi:hypothetical protein